MVKRFISVSFLFLFSFTCIYSQQYGRRLLNDEQMNLVSSEVAFTLANIIKEQNRTKEFIDKAKAFYQESLELDLADILGWGMMCFGAANNMGYKIDDTINILLIRYIGTSNIDNFERGAIHLSIGEKLYNNIDIEKYRWR